MKELRTDMPIRLTMRPAVREDVPFLTRIYNQAIAAGGCTCDTEQVNEENRRAWLYEHERTPQNPILICEADGEAVGYAYLSAYRPGRKAVSHVAEISYYLDFSNHGKGIGSFMLNEMVKIAKALHITVLIAILLDGNQASIALLKKYGFHEWGRLPQIVQFENSTVDHLIYGRKLSV